MGKHALYSEMIRRLDKSISEENYLEASWYCYAILEDRLISLMASGGSVAAPRMTMDKKLKALNILVASGAVEATNFEGVRLFKWKNERNGLIHAMAEGAMSIADIDKQVEKLGIEGAALVRLYSAAARRQKKRI